jgi:hypothetical protein
MKKFKKVLAIAMVAMGLTAGTTQAQAQEKKYTTDTFMVQYMNEDGLLEAKPVNPKHEGGYVLDNKYELGDIVEVTYWNDDIIEEHKLTGKELEKVEKKFEGNIDALMDEGEKITQEGVVATDNYMIQNIDKDGWATAKIVSDYFTGEATFKVEKNMSLGDIVSVTYNDNTGDIIEYHEVSDDVRFALMGIDAYMKVMKEIMKDGKQTKDLIMAEDGTFVDKDFKK